MHSLSGTAKRIATSLCSCLLLVACATEDASSSSESETNSQINGSTTPSYSSQWISEPSTPTTVGSCNAAIKPSSNCGDPIGPGEQRTCKLGNRSYIIRAGQTYDPCKPAALVVDIPSAVETAKQQTGAEKFCLGNTCWVGLGSGWFAESDTKDGGFIVVIPERNNAASGLVDVFSGLTGLNAFTNASNGSNTASSEDGKFVRDVIAQVKQSVDIDANRVYVSGLGDGGDLAWSLGCAYPDVFHGIAPNAAGSKCTNLPKSVPVISFAAKGDYAYDDSQSATQAVAKLNGCKNGPSDWRTFNNRTRDVVCRDSKSDINGKLVPCTDVTSVKLEPTTCKLWDQCNAGVEVVFCDVAPDNQHGAANATVDAHVVYYNNTMLNTPSVAWRFFRQFQ